MDESESAALAKNDKSDLHECTDEQLFDRFNISRDNAALGELFVRHKQQLMGFLLKRLPNRDVAEDTLQSIWLKFISAQKSNFDSTRNFASWLYTAASRLVIDHYRRKTSHALSLDSLLEGKSGEGYERITEDEFCEDTREQTPLENVLKRERHDMVHASLGTLSPRHRTFIHLKDFEDSSYSEVALASECPIGTVRSGLYNARAKIKADLEKQFSGEVY